MTSPRHVAILVFDGIQILDATGPAAVFSAANDAVGFESYRIHLLSAAGGSITSNGVVTISTAPVSSLAVNAVDTLLFSGGDDDAVLNAAFDPVVRQWVVEVSHHCRRLGAICSGALALAKLGLLDGRRATTHWSACAKLAALSPHIDVASEAVYVEDGHTWTSAGVTTGIDMSLQMVANDLGESIANAIAKRLVMPARRPGYISQVSPVILAQERADPDFSALLAWIKARLSTPINVLEMAEQVAMSPRTFHRKFSERFQQTPAHFVETLRLEQGRTLLHGGLSLKFIASECGYSNLPQFSKAFHRRFGISPASFRHKIAQQ